MRDRITRRLHQTLPPEDPAATALAGLQPDVARAWAGTNFETAAVLVPLMQQADGLSVLLTRRTETVRDHAGQISFPGGRTETGDQGPRDTALREAAEEIGIPPDRVSVVGYLETFPIVVSGYAVVPVVGFVATGAELKIDPIEVAEAFEVPLEYLLDPTNMRERPRTYRNIEVVTYEFTYAGHRIWGATAHMLKNFIDIIR